MSLTISCYLSFCHIFLSIFLFFLMPPYSKSCFFSLPFSLTLVSWVNIYIINSKFLNVKSREISLHTFLISDSPVTYAFLVVPCLYASFAIHGQQSQTIRDFHQSRLVIFPLEITLSKTSDFADLRFSFWRSEVAPSLSLSLSLSHGVLRSKLLQNIKDTLMQIWKFHYMFGFTKKQYPENFAFLILRIFKLFTRGVWTFLKK